MSKINLHLSIFLVALWAFNQSCQPKQVVKNQNTGRLIVSVTQMGAQPNDGLADTKAIQKAIDTVSQAGGGRVIVPTGVYNTGTVFLKNNVNLHLQKDAILLADTVLSSYPVAQVSYASYNRNYGGHKNLQHNQRMALIMGNGVRNVKITGQGVIDGNGGRGPDFKVKVLPDGSWVKPLRPFLVLFTSCQVVTIDSLVLQHSQMWNLHLENCDSVNVTNITINGHANANDDGIDINGSREVLVENCRVDVGDDALVFKTKGSALLKNVTVRNCHFASETRCIQFGSETEANIKNVSIDGCTLTSTKPRPEWPQPGAFAFSKLVEQRKGAAISINTNDGAVFDNINITNIYMDSVRAPFYLHTARRKWLYSVGKFDSTMQTGTIKNVTIAHVKAVNIPNTANPTIMGSPEAPLKNINLANIEINYIGTYNAAQQLDTLPNMFEHCAWPGYWGKRKHYPALALEARYVNGLVVRNFKVNTQHPDPRTLFLVSQSQNTDLKP